MRGRLASRTLTAADPDRLEELRAARARLVAAEDDLRRAIERTLHDGVQQQLVALGVKVQLAQQLADTDPAGLDAAFDELRRDVQETLDAVRRLAWEVYPALLLDHGPVPALRALGVSIEGDAIGRYSPDVEAAVYFSCVGVLERVPAARTTIHLEADADVLRFEIRADEAVLGPLLGVADRIGAVGGETTFTPSSIGGVIPLLRGTERPL